eukprot:CAMPEP_0172641702 /NCGR_PEP_ID=MMETSP1068-20121228/228664_1 /TAXON_ID=35684 /ORGANISM="Pseudopedinella elastica, Strain CCMP716" /LENGTH=169 /DNA_ID=CAMNT_0013455355 /DNA_START=115 /DNA_END=621 /DNA_ORIENTATION=+
MTHGPVDVRVFTPPGSSKRTDARVVFEERALLRPSRRGSGALGPLDKSFALSKHPAAVQLLVKVHNGPVDPARFRAALAAALEDFPDAAARRNLAKLDYPTDDATDATDSTEPTVTCSGVRFSAVRLPSADLAARPAVDQLFEAGLSGGELLTVRLANALQLPGEPAGG